MQTVIDTFQAPSNKAILVDVLARAGIITANTSRDIIVSAVDGGVEETAREAQATEDLVVLNKKALTIIQKKLAEPKPVSTEPVMREPYTAQDIAKQRKELFDTSLEQRQKEFDSFMTRDTPQGLKFTDEIDKPIGAEMDSLVQRAVAARNIDMEPNDVKLDGSVTARHKSGDTVETLADRIGRMEDLLQKIASKLDVS